MNSLALELSLLVNHFVRCKVEAVGFVMVLLLSLARLANCKFYESENDFRWLILIMHFCMLSDTGLRCK